MRAVRENIQPRTCRIDRAIARSIQQDRGWIFSVLPERLRSVSFLLAVWQYTFVENGKKRSYEGKVQSPTYLKKNNCKTFSLG